MTQQRKMMLEELQRRNYSQFTAEAYLRAMKGFVKHFHRGPEQLTQDHIREYQAYLFRERKRVHGDDRHPDSAAVVLDRLPPEHR